MKLHQLKAFVATLDSASFSEAALQLGIAQASVSHAISDLEKELGVKLLERGRFGAKGTPIGLKLASHARGAIRFTEAMEQEVHLAKGVVQGTLKVTSFRSAASRILPKIIAQLRKDHPQLSIQIVEIENEQTPGNIRRNMVREHQVDVALVSYAPPAEKSLILWKLMNDIVKAVVLKTDKRDTLSWEEAQKESLILPIGDDVHDTYTRWHLKNLMGDIIPAFEVKEDSTVVSMVSEGLGIGLMPSLAIGELPENVKAVDTDIALERPIYVAVLPSSLKVPAVRVFLKALKDYFPESDLPSLR